MITLKRPHFRTPKDHANHIILVGYAPNRPIRPDSAPVGPTAQNTPPREDPQLWTNPHNTIAIRPKPLKL